MVTKPKARLPRRAGVLDGLDMQKFEVVETGKTDCVGTIAMITRDKIAAPTAVSLMMTDTTYLQPGQYVKKFIIVGNVLTFQRNSCINEMEGDWILFIDSDMAWQPEAVRVLVETREKFDLDILGGLCFQRGDPYQPTLYKLAPHGAHGYTYLESWPQDAAVEVDATGMAFCLIHKRVFDRILRKATGEGFTDDFEERKKQRPAPFFRWEEEWGEDFLFCREAVAAGCRIFVDTSVKIAHVGEQAITEATFFREVAFRDPKATEFREAVLAEIGEKILTRDEALEKLAWK
jgi:hypothetical protein